MKYLDKNRFRNVLCTLRACQDLAIEVRAQQIPIHCLGTDSAWLPIQPLFHLVSLLKKYKVDILHTQIFSADIYGRIARLFHRQLILVSTLQSSTYEPGTEYLYSEKRRLVDSWTGNWCNDAFIAVSAFVKDSAVRNLGFHENKISIIPNSVDLEDFFNSKDPQIAVKKRSELGISRKEKVILTVGRLDPPKGHRFLFSALVEIRSLFPLVKLVVVGDGPLRLSLEILSRELGLTENIVFTGVRSDVPELLEIADLFVLPTLSEGLPVTLLEALAAGVPSIVSRIGPTEEIVTERVTGLLVPPRSPEALATSILHLLHHQDEAQAMGERGRKLVEDKFSAHRSAQSLTCLYHKLVEENIE